MPGPAATIGSMHICPMLNPGIPPPPHVGGPVTGPGVPTVLIGGMPAAVMGDMCTCAGPPDTIVQGVPTVIIGGKPAATMGSLTAHGGSVTVGVPNVLIGTGGSGPSTVTAIKAKDFPKISVGLRAMASITGKSKQLKEAITKHNALKQENDNPETERFIYNLQWVKGEREVRESKASKKVMLRAYVNDIPDGQTISFKIRKLKDPHDKNSDEEDVVELSGTVKDKMVEVEWEVEDPTEVKKG